MKRSAFAAAAALLLASATLFGCSEKTDGLTPVTLNEVAHSIFYAPSTQPLSWGILRRRELT